MSEIKVGDKVRVVQIIVKDNNFVFTDERVTYLGRLGEVVEVIPGYACPYFVLFPNTKGLKGNFCNSELKVLSAPCELRELEYLREKKAELILANEQLCKRNAEVTGANVRLDAEKENLRKENAELIDGHNRLVTMIAELQGKHDDMLQVNLRVRSEIRNILNSGVPTQ